MMTDSVDLSIRQLVGAWRTMCAASPRCAYEPGDGLELVFSGVPVSFFNVAVVTGRNLSADRLRACGRDACAFAAKSGLPWLFILTEESLEPGLDAQAILDNCGLAPMMPMTGMVTQHVAAPAAIPQGLELIVPQTDAACESIFDINAAAYGMDLAECKPTLGRQSFWKDHVVVLGLSDGKPVSSAAVFMVDDYRYVALVATLPDQQRRGFADAVMRRALELSDRAHPECPTLLHASNAGRPIYERMGYQPISKHMIYMEKRFLAPH